MKYIIFLIFLSASCTSNDFKKKQVQNVVPNIPACKAKVYVNGRPPDAFLKDLFKFIQEYKTDNVLVGVNNERLDTFSYLWNELEMQRRLSMHKRAARLFELMRVSGGIESTWNWGEGRDKSASNYSYYTREAGIFQTSPNSHVYAPGGKCCARWEYLDKLVAEHGITPPSQTNPDNKKWNALMRDPQYKDVIFKHHAFMLRHNYRHYGPMRDKKRVASSISTECIKQVEAML